MYPPHIRPKHFEAAIQARKQAFIEIPVGVDPAGVRSVIARGRMAESAGLMLLPEFREGIRVIM